MNIRPSWRLASLPGYPFAEIDRQVARLRDEGHDPVDFGVGDPTEPTPEVVRRAIQEAVDRRAAEATPPTWGPRSPAGDRGVVRRRFGVSLDPDREVSSNVGAKEAVFHFPLCLSTPGTWCSVPLPAIRPTTGHPLRGRRALVLTLRPEGGFLPDLDAIPTRWRPGRG
jgi:LL-diaminopimelate aminotransferase